METFTIRMFEGPNGSLDADLPHGKSRLPKGWDGAHGGRVGYFACDANCGDTGNAWAWAGPFATEQEAIDAVEQESNE